MPKLEQVNLDKVEIIARHNFDSGYLHPEDGRTPKDQRQHRLRHAKGVQNNGDKIWIQ